MSGLLGGGQNTSVDQLAGIQLQTSCYGTALPLTYGTTRIAGNLVDYDDFTSYSHTQSQGKGGGSSSTSYTYSAGAILALTEGAVSSINRVWRDKDIGTLAGYGLTLITGTRPQTPWPTWSSKHPAKALAYSGMALICNAAFDLGTSGAMRNHGFETTALLATEPDTGSLISLGTGNGTNKDFQLLDYSGNPIPDMSGYVTPSYYANGVVLGSGFTIVKISGTYYIRFTAAPGNGVAISWSTSLVVNDAKPSAVAVDFLSDPYHGGLWSASRIADLVTGAASYQTYCTAMGFAVSPCFNEQKPAAAHLQDLLTATNSEAVWTAISTGMILKIVPYGDVAITANGTTYTPATDPLYALGYDDFLGVLDQNGQATGSDPVTVARSSPGDVYNTIPVEFSDRMNAYNTGSVSDPEPVDVAQNGTRTGSSLSLHMITRRAMAKAISRIEAQKSVYVRNTYTFKVGWKYILLEPMDLVSITDAKLGLNALVVRIVSIDFPDDASEDQGMTITAEGWPFGTGTSTVGPIQNNGGTVVNTAATPGNANAPVIFDVPCQDSVSGGPEVIIATAGGQNWGGCLVYASADGSTYQQIGTIEKPCRYGVLTAGMLATGGASVDFAVSGGTLTSVDTATANDKQSMMWVNGEMVAYSTATLTGGYAYTLTLPVRGAYGTTAATHANGSSIVRVDDAVFRYPVPPSRLGTVMHIKLVSYNLYGGAVQDIATVTDYTYTPTSQGVYSNQPGDNGSQTGISILSGDYLTNLDKINLITAWNQELQTQTALLAQAALYSISHSAYDATLATLSGGLIAAGAPASWATIWPDNLTMHSTGICGSLAGWWASIAYQRGLLQSACSNAAAAAAQAAAIASAATNVMTKMNVMGLKTPSALGYAYASKPSLPNGAYPAGSCWLTTDSKEVQVNGDGTLWEDVIVAAAGVFGQLLASQLTIANYDNLVPNPNSEMAAPVGGWGNAPEGQGVYISAPDAYTGNGLRYLSAGQQILVTHKIPVVMGDTYNFSAMSKHVGSGTSQIYLQTYDANGSATGNVLLTQALTTTYTQISANWTVAQVAGVDTAFVAMSLYGNGGYSYFDNLYMRRCNDANVIVDGTLQALFARIAGAIASTNYSPTTSGSAATGFKLSSTGLSLTDITGTPRSDVLFDLGGSMLVGGYYGGSMAFAKLFYGTNGNNTFLNTGGKGATTAWSWTAPSMGGASSYRVRVTLQAGGAGGMGAVAGSAGGGSGAYTQIELDVTPGNVLSGVVGGGGATGGTTNCTAGMNTTLVLAAGTGTNVSGFTAGTLLTLGGGGTGGANAYGGGSTGVLVTSGAGPAASATLAIGGDTFIKYANGAGGGARGTTNGGSCGGFTNAGNGCGGSSCYGIGGAQNLSGQGASAASTSYGAGGGAGSTTGGAGADGKVIIQIL